MIEVLDRFWSKVDKDGPVPPARPDLGPCWIWTAGRDHTGYGDFRFQGRKRVAHRVAWILTFGSEPADGLELDHLCRVRWCVRPDHLEPVTHAENTRRGDTFQAANAAKVRCPAGHPYTPENTSWINNGHGRSRRCKACHNDRGRRLRGVDV